VAQRNEFRTARPHAPTNERGGEFEEGRNGGALRDHNYGRESAAGWERDEAGAIGQIVQRNPLTSVMTGFGLGLGFGLMVTLLLTRREQSWYERNLPSTIQHLPERLRRVPESLGSYIPSSWRYS
jgi:hypothetical protein